jgi:hypothetical protein
MPHFTNPLGKLHWYDEGDDVPEDMTLISDEQAAVLRIPTPEQAWLLHQSAAQIELVFSDRVATRCVKGNVPYPSDWSARDQVLREIQRVAMGDPLATPIPGRPVFPEGT